MGINRELLAEITDGVYQKNVLELQTVLVGEKDPELLVQALNSNPHITTLSWKSSDLTDREVALLADLKYVNSLDLTHNHITGHGAALLASKPFKKLILSMNSEIGSEGVAALANSPSLQHLELEGCVLTSADIKSFRDNKVMQVLNLSLNNIDDEIECLVTMPSLKELNVTDNILTHKGASLLAKSTVSTLLISSNRIGDDGLAAFKDNVSVKSLRASKCGIGDAGLAVLFESNVTIRKLYVSSNNITSKGAELLSSNRHLVDIDISFNQLDDAALTAFIKTHDKNPLRIVNAGFNSKITSEALLSVLQQHTFINHKRRIECIEKEQEKKKLCFGSAASSKS